MAKLTEDQLNEMIKLYQEGKPPEILGPKYGISNGSVSRIMRKRNIKRQLQKVAQDQIDQIIKEYNLGNNSEIIAKKFNIHATTVLRILQRNNIKTRPATQNKRKYKINENFFEKIDTQEKAYYLGLFYADGNSSKGGSEIKIGLKEKDKYLLDKFSELIYGFIKTNLNKKYFIKNDDKEQHFFYLPVYSEKMHKDLENAGAPPNKTFKIIFPTTNIVPQDLLPHFVRGYMDGDGGIYDKPKILITSNINFIQGMINYLTSMNIKCNKIQVNKKNPLIGYFEITGTENFINYCNLIYKDSTILMTRKHNVFQKILEKKSY